MSEKEPSSSSPNHINIEALVDDVFNSSNNPVVVEHVKMMHEKKLYDPEYQVVKELDDLLDNTYKQIEIAKYRNEPSIIDAHNDSIDSILIGLITIAITENNKWAEKVLAKYNYNIEIVKNLDDELDEDQILEILKRAKAEKEASENM